MTSSSKTAPALSEFYLGRDTPQCKHEDYLPVDSVQTYCLFAFGRT